MAPVTAESYGGERVILTSLIVGALGLLGSAYGLVATPTQAFYAWLTAFAYLVSIALGGLMFLMIGYAIGAHWPIVLRRLTEAIVGTFPVLALAFLPVVLGAGEIYLWVHPAPGLAEHLVHLLHHKAPYLNLPFFTLRAGIYFAVWLLVAASLRRESFAGDRSRDSRGDPEHRRARALSAALLPLVALTLTFASFDWLMSLQPEWSSTVFGVYYFAGGFVASLGLLCALAFAARRSGMVGDAITPFHFHALGRLLFAFSIFWAYIAYFQAMLIQIANRPEEVTFYLRRIDGGWSLLTTVLVVGRFVLPFFLLLPRAIKFRPRVMAVVGGWAVLLHYVDIFWLVAPVAPGHAPWPSVMDLCALAGLGGITVAFAAWRLRGHPLIPVGDPRLEEAMAYRSPL